MPVQTQSHLDVFPFPPTPSFNSLMDVCKYLNDCGLDVTWQSFYRFYSSYVSGHLSSLRQRMRDHGVDTELNKSSQHDKISMLIVKEALQHTIRPVFKQAIERWCPGNRDQMVTRMYRYALHGIPEVETWRERMIEHLDAVIAAMVDSLEADHGGETNQAYLSRLYKSSMRSTMACAQINRHPEEWFVVLSNQQDMNVDVLVPHFSRCYVGLYQAFASLMEEEKPDMDAMRKIREDMKRTMREFGCSPLKEKQIYRACGDIIVKIDDGLVKPEHFEELAYSIVHDELAGIAKRSVSDILSHVAVIDHGVAQFISEIFNIDRERFEKCRFTFAENVAKHLSQGSVPQSSGDNFFNTAC